MKTIFLIRLELSPFSGTSLILILGRSQGRFIFLSRTLVCRNVFER